MNSKVSKHLSIIYFFVVNELFFKASFNILNTNSTEAKSGEYFGIYNKYIFKILAKSVLCAFTLSRNITIRGIFAQISGNLYGDNKL